MLSKIPSFRDCDFENFTELSVELQESKFFTNGYLNPKISNDQTSLTQHENLQDFHFTKSSLLVTRDYEISFEADFMEEHQNAFKKQMENFIESSFKFHGNRTITFQSQEIFGENLQFGAFSEDEENLHKFQENTHFLKILEKQEKLIEYMEFIYKTVPKEVAFELTYLAFIAWNRHIISKESQQSQLKISEKSKKLADEECQKIFYDDRLKFLNFKIVSTSELHPQTLIKSAFKSFLEFFFATIILVGQQFFENPYDEAQIAKRERTFGLEDDDDNEPSSTNSITFGKPTKKLHFY